MPPTYDVAVIGAGLAGTASAIACVEAGYNVVLLDGGSGGASAIPAAVMAPYPTAPTDRLTQIRTRGARYTSALLDRLEARGLDSGRFARGVILLPSSERDRRRHRRAQAAPGSRVEFVAPEVAARELGFRTGEPALFHRDGAAVRPRQLTRALLASVGHRLLIENVAIASLEHRAQSVVLRDGCDRPWGAAARVILAAGPATTELWPTLADRIRWVRGQASAWRPTRRSAPLRVPLSGGGYVTPLVDGMHWTGGTAQPGEQDAEPRLADLRDNRARLRGLDPDYPDDAPIEQFVGVRATTRDHLPLVGQLAERIWINTGHGAHGLMTAPLAGRQVRHQIERSDR